MRLSLKALAIAGLSALALASCSDEPDYTGRVIVDLNRTTSATVAVRSVMTDSARAFTLAPDANGVYTFVTDTLPTDLYVLTLDSSHVLTLVLRSGEAQKVCGTVREWASLSVSDPETRAAMSAEAMRRRLAVATDSARKCLTRPDGRKVTTDSLAKIRVAFRLEADAMLRSLPDTSLATLPLLGMPGLYDCGTDNAMLLRRATALATRWPELTKLSERRDFLLKVKRLNTLRDAYAAGTRMTDFLFVSTSGDTLTAANMAGKRMVMAFLPDSAATPRSVTSRLGLMAMDGTPVLIQSADGKAAVAGRGARFGRFMSVSRGADIDLFRPVVIIVAKDGSVERLSIGK